MQQTIETQEILKQKKTIESKIIEETIYYQRHQSPGHDSSTKHLVTNLLNH